MPSTSVASAGEYSTFSYSMQAGSFATAEEADDFLAYVAGYQPCEYVHDSGAYESMHTVRSGSIAGWPVLWVDYTFTLDDGTVFAGSDGYVSDGKVVGVIACSMGQVSDAQVCDEVAAVFFDRLANVAYKYS